MKRLLLISLVFLIAATGCVTRVPAVDIQKPTAYIDEISPTEAPLETVVSFVGHGTDPASDVVAYRWRSDLDGYLSSSSSFTTSSLSLGRHKISLRVRDNLFRWSVEADKTINVVTPCPGNFDCDLDVDGVDAAKFKADFGRNQYSNPLP